MNAIEMSRVSKTYGDFALEDVNLTLPQGCVLGLIGENGAGKSTLIRMMLGACKPDGGEVRVLGEAAGRTAAFAKTRQEIGVVLDEACLPDELTARQIGTLMRGIYANWDDAAFSSLCTRLELPEGKKVKDFSRGTKMKLAIAVALSHKAKLLVLDEATGGLDPVVRDEILDLLNDFTREEEHAILLSSHIVTDLEKICDYVVFLHKGRAQMAGEKDELLERYALLNMTHEDYAALDKRGVVRVMDGHGGVRVLMERQAVPRGTETERLGLEDMMLLLEKGEKAQ